MCAICHRTPCDSRCPNAPEPPVAFECENCGCSICVGENYIAIKGGPVYCENCCVSKTAEFDDIETEI